MSILSVDSKFPRHTKVAPLSDAAFRLHVAAMSYCAEHETDGFIPESEVSTLTKHPDKAPLIQELENARGARETGKPLWSRSDRSSFDGWQIHDFLDWNASHAMLEAERAKETAKRERNRSRMKVARVPSEADVHAHKQCTLDARMGAQGGSQVGVLARVSPQQVSNSKENPDRSADPDGDSNRARGARGSRLPNGWSPTETDLAFAAERGWNAARVAEEAIKFESHHMAKGTISQSWAASWRTWVSNGLRFDKKDRVSGVHRSGPSRAVQGAPLPVSDDDAPTVVR